jgi:hypothetical protein
MSLTICKMGYQHLWNNSMCLANWMFLQTFKTQIRQDKSLPSLSAPSTHQPPLLHLAPMPSAGHPGLFMPCFATFVAELIWHKYLCIKYVLLVPKCSQPHNHGGSLWDTVNMVPPCRLIEHKGHQLHPKLWGRNRCLMYNPLWTTPLPITGPCRYAKEFHGYPEEFISFDASL